MDKITAQRISDFLERLDRGSRPYSRIESLHGEENVRGFSFKPEYDNFGAHMISGKGRNLWFIAVKWPEINDYTIAVHSDKKRAIMYITKEEYTYSPRKRDERNPQRKERFASCLGAVDIFIPFPRRIDDINEYLGSIFYVVEVRLWAEGLENKPAPERKSFTYKNPETSTILNTILYGPPGTGKTYATFRRCVEICDGKESCPDENDEVRPRYKELVEEGRIEFVTFHQSYGYEEFVEGLRPDTGPAEKGEKTGSGFRLVPTPGVLKRIAKRARGSSGPTGSLLPLVLVIDEINRANVSKVMGELITLLEEDKREGAENEVAVTLPHSRKPFKLPANLYVLGTMNTADRSIALLDTALRRRFEFEELVPDPGLLKDAAEATGIRLPAVLRTINERLEYLIDRDHLIGHAWLMGARTRADVDHIMRHKIIPLIAEYFYDDWRKVQAVLGGTDDFVRGETLNRPPGLDDDMMTDEERRRWTIRDEFAEGAYARLISGQAQESEQVRNPEQAQDPEQTPGAESGTD